MFSRSIQPIVTLILARLLTPLEFGIVAIATGAIGLAQIFQEFGLGKAIIQTEKNVKEYANNAFWINVGIGTVLYILIYSFAPSIAEFFKSPEASAVLRVLCIQILIMSLLSVHSALLRRNLKFKSIFIIRLTTSVLPGIGSVIMALLGMGVWSLVYGALIGSVAQLILYWLLSDWRPNKSFDLNVFKKMVMFSKWIMFEGVLAWFILWADSIVLGHYLGVKELGVYRLGSTLIIFASNIFFTPIVHVALSFFSRLQSDLRELTNCYKKLTQLVVTLSFPLGVGIAVLAKPIVTVFLGDKWIGTEIVISLLAIKLALGWLVGLNSTIYTANGRPDLNIKLLVLVTLISIPAYIYGAQYGLFVFCVVRLITSIIDNCLNFIIAKKHLNLPMKFIGLVWTPLICTVCMLFVIVSFMNFIDISHWSVLGLAVIVGIISYLGSIYVLNREYFIWSYQYAMQLIH